MNTYDSNPAAAACAATELAKLPVDAQAIVRKPNSIALLIATATTRSLKDSVGGFTESFLIHSLRQPKTFASRGAASNGVKPTDLLQVGSPSSGKNSR